MSAVSAAPRCQLKLTVIAVEAVHDRNNARHLPLPRPPHLRQSGPRPPPHPCALNRAVFRVQVRQARKDVIVRQVFL